MSGGGLAHGALLHQKVVEKLRNQALLVLEVRQVGLRSEPPIASPIFDEVLRVGSDHSAVHHDALDRLRCRYQRRDPAARAMSKKKDILAIHEIVWLEFSQRAREERDFVAKTNVATRRTGAVADSALFAPHDDKTRSGQPVNEFAGEIWFRQRPIDRRAVKPLQEQDCWQLARIAVWYCQKASQCGLGRVNGVVKDLNVSWLLPRPITQGHLDIHLLLISLHAADEVIPGFEGFHSGQERGNGLDGGAVNGKQSVPNR